MLYSIPSTSKLALANVRVPKLKSFDGAQSAKDLENFL